MKKIPTHLRHIPLVKVENYESIDGPYAKNSDAQGLSVGIAQWNGAGEAELSAKVWRHTGDKWSRQSEELPLHRVFDLASLICYAMQYSNDPDLLPKDSLFNISLAENSSDNERLIAVMKAQFVENKGHLDASLDRLVAALKMLGKI